MILKQTIICSAIMVMTSLGIGYLQSPSDMALQKSLSTFPVQIDDWSGKMRYFDDRVYEVLGVDDSFLANYYNPAGENIQLYIGYYKSQREGEIIHSPKNCMPGAGWNILDAGVFNLDLKKTDGKPIKVGRMILQKGQERQVAFYWYHSRGRVITSEYQQKLLLVWDSITRRRTDGAFVRLLAPTMAADEMQTTQKLKRFAESVFPILKEFIPE